MDADLIFEMLSLVIGGLGIFLLGMKNMSEGMQAVAGDRLRKLIGLATSNRFVACGVGTAVTCLIQSSSVTTVMVVGFVNGGFMDLMQAIGVIIGANIGTTITGWILVLNIGKWGLPILGIMALFYLFNTRDKMRYSALCIMGIGMVFFGLETMSAAFKQPEVKAMLHTAFSCMSAETFAGIVKCALVGCVATMIVQSSSASLGVTIALAREQVIDFHTAAGLIAGLNIGTTITAFLASLGTNSNAKRAAYAHIIFNIAGTLWLIPLIFPYTNAVLWLTRAVGRGGDITTSIALAHSGFNIINAAICLPIMHLLARLVSRLVPHKAVEETPHLAFLDVRLVDTPAIGIQQSADEIVRMSEGVTKMMNWLRESLVGIERDEARETKIFHREQVLDAVQKEVVEFLSNLLSGTVPQEIMRKGRQQLRIADEYESISDYIADLLKLRIKLIKAGHTVSPEGMNDLLNLHDHVAEYILLINTAVKAENRDVLNTMRTKGEIITRLAKESRTRHLQRVETGSVSPLKSLMFTDMLMCYRKIRGHAINIAEALAD